jgi:tetratricopeptide (TPR) repeat protein
MSIITQALKKAQLAQRLQQTPGVPYSSLSLLRPQAQPQPFLHRASPRRAALITASVVLFLGGVIVAYLVQSERHPRPVAMTVQGATPANSSSALTSFLSTTPPHPPAPRQSQPESIQDTAPAPRTEIAKAATPTTQQTPPTPLSSPSVAPSTSLEPKKTAGVTPDVDSEERRHQAQQQLYMGIEAHEAGALDAAETAFKQAIALDPALTYAMNRLGNVYYQRHAFQQALAMYQRALDLDPDYVEARNNLGNTYMQLDMSDQAISELNKAILVDRESALTYYNMACVYARTHNLEKAIRYLEMAIAREPKARRWAQTDTDFKALQSTSAFQKLLGTSS